MPWLFIDTCERGLVRLAFLPACPSPSQPVPARPAGGRQADGWRAAGRSAQGRIKPVTRRARPGGAVPVLASFISPPQLARLDGICVVVGPGSFSAVRAGVLVANLLSRLRGLRLYALSRNEAADLRRIRARLVSGGLVAVPYAAPVYDAEPNITC